MAVRAAASQRTEDLIQNAEFQVAAGNRTGLRAGHSDRGRQESPEFENRLLPVLDELHRPFVAQVIEEATDVGIEHPVHPLPLDAHR